jgi:thiol:disulfide interchange protein DsbC
MLNFNQPTHLPMTKKNPLPTLIAAGLTALGLFAGMSVLANSPVNAKAAAKTTGATPSAQEISIAKNFALKFEGAAVVSVHKTKFNDLYEVTLEGNQLVYTDANTSFTLVGNLLDNQTQRNLTEERLSELNKVPFNTFPTQQAFVAVKGNGSRKMVLFEDPNCGYCKRFRETIEGFTDLTIYTYVVDILGDDSTAKAKALMCAKDPAKAWDDWMLHGIKPANVAKCDTSALQKNKALAIKLGITGTPTVFLEDGSRLPGAVSKEALEVALAKQVAK